MLHLIAAVGQIKVTFLALPQNKKEVFKWKMPSSIYFLFVFFLLLLSIVAVVVKLLQSTHHTEQAWQC